MGDSRQEQKILREEKRVADRKRIAALYGIKRELTDADIRRMLENAQRAKETGYIL